MKKKDDDLDPFGRRYRSESPKPKSITNERKKSPPKAKREKGLNYFSDGERESDMEKRRDKRDEWCWRRKAKPGEINDDNEFDGLLKEISPSISLLSQEQKNKNDSR